MPSRHNSIWETVREGFRYVRGSRSIMLLLTIGTLTGLFAMPYQSLLPIFADDILKGGPKALGILMSASGVGAFIGAMFLATQKHYRNEGLWMATGSLMFGVILALFAQSSWFWLSASLMLLAGLAQIVLMTVGTVSVQNSVPDALRGRVLALYGMVQQGIPPFGALLVGLFAGQFGAVPALTLGGILCALSGLWLFKQTYSFRELSR